MKSIPRRRRVDILAFREFTTWYNERACDGRWGMSSAMVCIDLMAEIRKAPFWKRKRVWRERRRKQVLAKIVDPSNQKILINEPTRGTSHISETITSEKEHPTTTINEYQSQTLHTESHATAGPAPYVRILDGLMDLNGEAGEAVGILKKVLSQGHELGRKHMTKEPGDIAWHLAVSTDAIGYDLKTISQMNIDRLKS